MRQIRSPTNFDERAFERFTLEFVQVKQPTSSLTVWFCVVDPSVMQHAAILRRYS